MDTRRQILDISREKTRAALLASLVQEEDAVGMDQYNQIAKLRQSLHRERDNVERLQSEHRRAPQEV